MELTLQHQSLVGHSVTLPRVPEDTSPLTFRVRTHDELDLIRRDCVRWRELFALIRPPNQSAGSDGVRQEWDGLSRLLALEHRNLHGMVFAISGWTGLRDIFAATLNELGLVMPSKAEVIVHNTKTRLETTLTRLLRVVRPTVEDPASETQAHPLNRQVTSIFGCENMPNMTGVYWKACETVNCADWLTKKSDSK